MEFFIFAGRIDSCLLLPHGCDDNILLFLLKFVNILSWGLVSKTTFVSDSVNDTLLIQIEFCKYYGV